MNVTKIHKNGIEGQSGQHVVNSEDRHKGKRFDIDSAMWHKLILATRELKSFRAPNPIADNRYD